MLLYLMILYVVYGVFAASLQNLKKFAATVLGIRQVGLLSRSQ